MVSWSDLKVLQSELASHLPEDYFLKTVLKGAMRVARDKKNPIRGNLLASALRELVGHILHGLAPDTEVRNCVWFVQAEDTKTVTRRQRANYIVHAGLPDNFVETKLEMHIATEITPLIDAMNDLNRSTHVRAETVVYDSREVRTMMYSVLHGLLTLLESAQESRARLTDAVSHVMRHAVFDNLISETIQELDEISTHTTVSGHEIEIVEVRSLTATQIEYTITGYVEVELQYGSNSDVRNDIGYREDDHYPYSATVISNPASPLEIRSKDINIKVDNSRFFE
ncbi:hypothetical protein V6768_13120 [Tistrella mobilis]